MNMKRIISLLLAVILLFSAAACSKKDDVTPENGESTTVYVPVLPVIENDNRRHEYKAADGTVSYVLDVTIPKITENITADVVDLLDYYFEDIYKEAVRSATENIENARKFMLDMSNSNTPWQRTISFETVYCSEDYVSFKFTDMFSMLGGQTTPKVYAKLYNIKTGALVTLPDFAIDGDEAAMRELLIPAVIDKADKEFYADGRGLTDEQKQSIADEFKTYDFCYSGDYITFFINKTIIDQSYSGTYCCEFIFTELSYIFDSLENIDTAEETE